MAKAHILKALGHRVSSHGHILTKLSPGPSVGPVEDNVPMPRARNNAGLRETMTGMKPGQSFVTSISKEACYRMAKKLGFRVEVRSESDTRIRVWRIKEGE